MRRSILRQGVCCALVALVLTIPVVAENRALPGNEGLEGPADPLTIPAGGGPGVLDTGYVDSSGWCGGPYIDLTAAAASDVTIVGWQMYFKGTVNRDVDMWWRAGSYIGSETTPGDWTFLGSVNVTPGGDGTLTAVDLGGITIPAGQTYAFKVWDGGTGSSDGPGLDIRSGGVDVANADLSLFADEYTCFEIWSGLGGVFGWQGQVLYTLGAPVPALEPAAIAILAAVLLLGALLVLRRRSREV